ncbi:hypothetical protein FHR83_005705 [Actinoplanes campanulatus]|uniref:Uncharacterized protein n=1 Tax=Actinoplanes campanulatus TaxID=113559 RepID=A0A7W5FH17_9ACTN|nr:hypothetical protein [Actinoplanes campanulatus]MBB3098020.1 hypothetical protein [Actinoplanes campanulatus]
MDGAAIEGEWRRAGLERFQQVRCRVVEHRGRFGVDVEIIEPVAGYPAFIDFVLLGPAGAEVTPADFPPVGTILDAVTIDFMPWGELRLSAR